MRTGKALAVAVLVAAMSLLSAGTASAASPRATHGNDWGEIRGNLNDKVIVCDGENDGKVVWAQVHVIVTEGVTDYWEIYDIDGPNNNSCGYKDWFDKPYVATAIRICEHVGGCGDWEYAARSTPVVRK